MTITIGCRSRLLPVTTMIHSIILREAGYEGPITDYAAIP